MHLSCECKHRWLAVVAASAGCAILQKEQATPSPELKYIYIYMYV
jgi:hypothetical protein